MNEKMHERLFGSAWIKALLTVCGVLMIAFAFFYITHRVHAQGKKGAGESGGPPPMPEVSVVSVQAQRVSLATELPGRISAFLVAEVRPQVSGIIQDRLFIEGADVQAGQPLYRVDPATFQAVVNRENANIVGAQKAVKRASAALDASLANVKQAQVTLDLALKDRQRFEQLAKDGAVSLSERDHAVTKAEVAEATLRAVEAQLVCDRESVAVAEAAIQQAEAGLEVARINLAYTRITATISGRIGKSNLTVGALATAHQPLPLATIQQIDPIYVDIPQSTTDLLRLRRRLEEGRINHDGENLNKVGLVLEDGSEYPLEGTLQFRDVTVDQSTGSVILRIVFPNPEGILLPGMFVQAIVPEGIHEQAILIPQQAVSRDRKGNPLTLLVDADGKVEQRMLTLDRAIGDQWLVSSGLTAGERVIVEGVQRLRPGASVKTVAFHADGPHPANSEEIAQTLQQSN